METAGVMGEEAMVDWRGRSTSINPSKHGGMRAAGFVLGIYNLSDLFLCSTI